MELTILLAQVFGLYAIIGGVAIVLREAYFVPVLGAFVKDRLSRLIIALLEILGGLFMVLTHNDWSSLPAGIITLFGWALLLEGVFYLLASDKAVEGIIKMFNNRTWYLFGGLLSVALGVYLAGFGFGLF